MDYLKSKPSLGKIILVKETEKDEVYSVGEGRFSLTKKRDYYLINFWVKAEYEAEIENQLFLVSGPTLEILTRTNEDLTQKSSIKLSIPNQDEVKTEWEEDYHTHFYHQTHQSFVDVKIRMDKIEKGKYNIEFSGIPLNDRNLYKVKGNVRLSLSNELIKYW